MRYDEAQIVGRDFSYKELFHRSLSEGTIYIYENDKKIKMTGIKAAPEETAYRYNGGNYVLKFNGDLYLNRTIIDQNVIDIGFKCYIKRTGIYVTSNYEKIEFPAPDFVKSRILNISYVRNGLYQFCTSNAIYFNYYDNSTETNSIFKFDMDFDIIKIFTKPQTNYKIITYILTNNNKLLIYYGKKFMSKPKIITNVTDLGKNYVCINKKYYYFYVFNSEFNFALDDLIPFEYCSNGNKETNTKNCTSYRQ